jgi:hypothetical protein
MQTDFSRIKDKIRSSSEFPQFTTSMSNAPFPAQQLLDTRGQKFMVGVLPLERSLALDRRTKTANRVAPIAQL